MAERYEVIMTQGEVTQSVYLCGDSIATVVEFASWKLSSLYGGLWSLKEVVRL